MLREVGEFDGQGFSFGEMTQAKAPALVSIDNGAQGATATIADAHLLFNADFARSGNDLHLNGHDGERAIVRDYFIAGERVALVSGEGARLSPDIVEALTGGIAPAQYAQAGQPAGQPAAPAASDAVGRVVTSSGDAVILRNGVPVTLRPGDPVLRADVLQTTSGTMAVTFNDGSTLNLTANTRIVVSEFVYSPNGAGNSQLLDLVQGSLSFISGEVAHSGNMRIGTPVATMGIRGTVGGVTTASDGTVQFYVSQSNVGAVIINQQGQIIANVVQDGPLIIVRPIGPLQVIAEELQKTPQQLAIELQALQAIVNIKTVGDQLLQQFQLQQPNPNPQTPQSGPHTQIQTEQKLAISFMSGNDENGGTAAGSPGLVTVGLVNQIGDAPGPGHVTVPLPVNLAPVTFAPLNATMKEDTPLAFGGHAAIVVADSDSAIVSVRLTVPFGTLATGAMSGTELLLSGSPAAVSAMLAGLIYNPPQDYNGPVTLTVVSTDGASAPITTTVNLTVTPVNDAPVIAHAPGTGVAYTENDAATVISGGLTLNDVDSATLSGARVFISGNFAAGQDVLSFTAQGGITGSYNAQTGILTLSGVASLADYQAVLRSVTYENTSDNPSGDARTISFEVNDGGSENGASTTTTVTVDVTPENDAPVLDANCASTIYTENDCPVAIVPNITVSDVDSDTLHGAVIRITGNFDSCQDSLGFTNQNGICGTYDAECGILTLTGTASVADYEAALRSITYSNSSDDPSDCDRTISITVDDGNEDNGQSNTVTATVEIEAVNDAPIVTGSEATVSEADLGGCLPETASGSIVANDAEGDGLTYALGEPVAELKSGGELISWSGAGTGTLVGYVCETPVITITLDTGTGAYTVTLHGAIDHPEGCEGDALTFDVPIVVSDGQACTETSIAVTVEDDTPRAVNYNYTATAAGLATVNLVIMLDLSGSMDIGNRLGLAQDALHNLLTTTDVAINQVMVVGFDSSVTSEHLLTWTSAAAAGTFIDGLSAGSGTNYLAATNAVMDNWGAGPTPADKTLVYFISDGEPNLEQGLNSEAQTDWQNFLSSHNVDVSNAIGISTNVNDPDLAPIAWREGDVNFGPIILTSADGLSDTLQGTVIETHSIFEQGGADFGGDNGEGAHIASLVVDGVTYSWDGTDTISSSDSEVPSIRTAASVTVVTALGGTLVFYFGDDGNHQAGDWTYTPPADVEHSANETFRYTIADADGDTASADINVTVLDKNGPDPVQDIVVTNASEFDIPDWVLLRNDHNAGNLLEVSDAYVQGNEPAISVDDCDDQVSVTLNDTNSETFHYVATDPNDKSASTTVSVTQTCDLDLSQTCDDSIIIAGNGGASMAGGSGNNVLIGGNGCDTLTGNGGADIFVFKAGNGQDVVMDFSGHANGGQGDVISLDGFCFGSFAELKQNADIGTGGDGHDTVIDFGDGNTITLVDVDPNDLTAADFIFHQQSTNLV